MTVKLEKIKARIAKGRAQIKELVAQAAELRASGKPAAKPAAKSRRAPAKRRSTSRSTQAQASA